MGLKELLAFAKRRVEIHKVIHAETIFAKFVVKNNDPFCIYHGFSKIGSDLSSDSELARKYGAVKTKTAEIIKDKGNHFSVLKKLNVYSVGLRR